MRYRWALVPVFAGLSLVLPLLAVGGRAATDPNEPTRDVEGRLSRLEWMVGSSGSDRSLAQRLDTLERTLQELTRAAGGTSSLLSPQSNARELQEAVRDQRLQIDELSRQMSAIQQGARGNPAGDRDNLETDMRNLRTNLSNLRRALDRLETRVERVEARK